MVESGMTTPTESLPTALVVEDEQNIRDLVCLHLGLEGFKDGLEALQRAEAQRFNVIVLDVMLPGLDGLSVCRAVRRGTQNGDVPILMLTARLEETDNVLGLETGADDYLTKPFGVRELVARVRALLRRGRYASGLPAGVSADKPLTYRHIAMDPAKRRVTRDGMDVDLTTHEFDLLYVLLSHQGIVFSRSALLSRTWKDNTFVTERSVDSLVKRVRKKIEQDPANPEVIATVWGAGYKAADV
jgi:two-component system OmpR family response regulator/two-component system alkaline phosphatase synthesis response regulator PhoP